MHKKVPVGEICELMSTFRKFSGQIRHLSPSDIKLFYYLFTELDLVWAGFQLSCHIKTAKANFATSKHLPKGLIPQLVTAQGHGYKSHSGLFFQAFFLRNCSGRV